MTAYGLPAGGRRSRAGAPRVPDRRRPPCTPTVREVLAGGQRRLPGLLARADQHLPPRWSSCPLRQRLPGQCRQQEASHAWVEVFIPPYGWVGFDPTAGTACTGRHVKVAVGPRLCRCHRGPRHVSRRSGARPGGHGREPTMIGETSGAWSSVTSGGRGEMIQYQTLGSMQQLQRARARCHRAFRPARGRTGQIVRRQGGSCRIATPRKCRKRRRERPRNSSPQQRQQRTGHAPTRRGIRHMQLSVGCEFTYECSAAPCPRWCWLQPASRPGDLGA